MTRYPCLERLGALGTSPSASRFPRFRGHARLSSRDPSTRTNGHAHAHPRLRRLRPHARPPDRRRAAGRRGARGARAGAGGDVLPDGAAARLRRGGVLAGDLHRAARPRRAAGRHPRLPVLRVPALGHLRARRRRYPGAARSRRKARRGAEVPHDGRGVGARHPGGRVRRLAERPPLVRGRRGRGGQGGRRDAAPRASPSGGARRPESRAAPGRRESWTPSSAPAGRPAPAAPLFAASSPTSAAWNAPTSRRRGSFRSCTRSS